MKTEKQLLEKKMGRLHGICQYPIDFRGSKVAHTKDDNSTLTATTKVDRKSQQKNENFLNNIPYSSDQISW